MSRAVDEHLFKRQGANKNSAEEKGFCPKKIIVARWPQWPAVAPLPPFLHPIHPPSPEAHLKHLKPCMTDVSSRLNFLFDLPTKWGTANLKLDDDKKENQQSVGRS